MVGHRWLMAMKVRVSTLDGDANDRSIGVEVTEVGFGKWQMNGAALSVEQAEDLVRYLNSQRFQ